MKINQINLGSTQSGTKSTDAQVKNSDSSVAVKRPVEKSNSENPVKKINQPESEEFNDQEMLKKSVDQANKSLEIYHRRIDRVVHEVTHTVMYTIKDTITNEVISEFPPRKIQDMIAKMWELAGLFVDEKA